MFNGFQMCISYIINNTLTARRRTFIRPLCSDQNMFAAAGSIRILQNVRRCRIYNRLAKQFYPRIDLGMSATQYSTENLLDSDFVNGQ